jgi:hypothetical protein
VQHGAYHASVTHRCEFNFWPSHDSSGGLVRAHCTRHVVGRFAIPATSGSYSSGCSPPLRTHFHRLRHLRAGGRVVVTADVFVEAGGISLRFLGKQRLASSVAARLAALAQVPLIAIVPVYRDKRLQVQVGATIVGGESLLESPEVTRQLLALFEAEMRKQPQAWGDTIGTRCP